MGSDSRRQWTAEAKLQILDEARKAGQAVSEVCRRHQIAPGQFYQWEQQARKGALQALHNGKRGRKPNKTEEHLKTEITRLRTVVAELSAETLQLKKGSGRKATPSIRCTGEDPAPGGRAPRARLQ